MRELRKRVAERSRTTNTEIPRIEAELPKLRKEIENMAEAIAVTCGSVDVLAKKLAERQEKLSSLEARLILLKSAPDVLALETRRLERDARERLKNLREVLHRADVTKARQVLHTVLEDGLRFTPRRTADGCEYRIEGRLVLGGLLTSASGAMSPLAGPGEGGSERGRPRRDSNPC